MLSRLVFLLSAVVVLGACSSRPSSNEGSGLRILPLGDSITEGAPFTYRYAFAEALADQGVEFDMLGSRHDAGPYAAGWDTDHEGHSGWAIHDLDTRLDGWLADYTPDEVLLHIGTNDLAAIAYGVYGGPHQGAFSYCGPTIPGAAIHDLQSRWNTDLAAIASELSTRQAPVRLVDMNTGFSPSDLHDGLHPGEAASERMAEIFAESVLAEE